MSKLPLDFSDIQIAAQRLAPFVVRTPLLESERLNEELGTRVLFKAECLQRTGAFKFRGASNFLEQIPAADRARGVIAFSSGNHAQAVAAAAPARGLRATIVMPADAPALKIRNTRDFGAEVILYDRARESREAIAAEHQARTGATLVPPFDHPWTIAGQGTAAVEFAEQAKALGARLDSVLVPCSGGGFVAGCALALRELSPQTRVYGVEPALADDTRRSLASGTRQANESASPPTICDALVTQKPGELTFSINQNLLAGALTVSDDEVLQAMATAFRHLKVVVEPGGSAGLAAVLAGRVPHPQGTIGVILSGGNVDAQTFARALSLEATR